MALKGTLKDFGIADILQLIGQQQKTGTLHLRSKDQAVQIGFKDGNIVRAESSTRKKKDLIGAMLVRAQIITEGQLESALQTQRRTLKRLGDVLVESKYIGAERFKQMMQLQATETLYRLFGWKSGTYEFEQGELQIDPEDVTPLRAESVLMEGFRMVDEWPVIRRKIPHDHLSFEKLKELPPPREQDDEADVDDAFDDAFAEKKKDENKGDFKSIGDSERRVYELIRAGRDVRKLVDLSCLGEFETCKALCNLLNLEYIRSEQSERGGGAGLQRLPLAQMGRMLGGVALSAIVLGTSYFVASRLQLDSMSFSRSPASSYADPAAQRFISRAQRARIEAALEVFRLEKGELPESLERLVDAGLLAPEDLRYPWRDTYYYRRLAARQFILLPPLR